MILLDTNVVSETTKVDPHPKVRAWLDAQRPDTLFLSSITVAELLFGIGVMPSGKRRLRLSKTVHDALVLFAHRTLPFDVTAARHFAELAVKARAIGKGFPLPDGYIAAIAAASGFAVATRDTSAFVAAGVPVINPWG